MNRVSSMSDLQLNEGGKKDPFSHRPRVGVISGQDERLGTQTCTL